MYIVVVLSSWFPTHLKNGFKLEIFGVHIKNHFKTRLAERAWYHFETTGPSLCWWLTIPGKSWLVVSTHLENMLVKLDHLPRDRGENKHI